MWKALSLASSGSPSWPVPTRSWVRARCHELRQQPPAVSTRPAANNHTSAPGLPLCYLPPPPPQFLLPPPLNPCGIINPRCGIRQLDLNFQNHNAFELENSRTMVRQTRKFQDHQVLEHFPFQARDRSEPNNFKNAASRNQRSKPQKRI